MPAPLSHARLGEDLPGIDCPQFGAREAYLYLQVTRGAEFGRNHAWPEDLKPTLFAYCTALGAAVALVARARAWRR